MYERHTPQATRSSAGIDRGGRAARRRGGSRTGLFTHRYKIHSAPNTNISETSLGNSNIGEVYRPRPNQVKNRRVLQQSSLSVTTLIVRPRHRPASEKYTRVTFFSETEPAPQQARFEPIGNLGDELRRLARDEWQPRP
jgi:hypothetical protein